MVLTNGSEASTPDPSLCRLIARAHGIRERLQNDTGLTLKEIARQEDVVSSYVTRLLRLSYLAPDIIAAILKGSQPAELTASRLTAAVSEPTLAFSAFRDGGTAVSRKRDLDAQLGVNAAPNRLYHSISIPALPLNPGTD